MAIFFFVIGLELKRELVEGELSDPSKIILPAIAAIGGMLLPAICYIIFNYDNKDAIEGWAIPAATDIAFALGVLSLLGSRVPRSLKIFLTSLAIFDDVGAIIIIAIFYTSKLSLAALGIVALCVPVLWLFNRNQVSLKAPYIMIGVIMWVAMLKSGVHATLTGVLLAMFIPLRTEGTDKSPLKTLEHDFHDFVAFIILPIFAFANSGLNLRGMTMEQLTHDVPVGIAVGLFVGKQIGIFGFSLIFVKLKMAKKPTDISWLSLYGTSALCGIGFTMSLFIGGLAFEETGVDMVFDERLGIILGSLLSGIVGYLILNKSLPPKEEVELL